MKPNWMVLTLGLLLVAGLSQLNFAVAAQASAADNQAAIKRLESKFGIGLLLPANWQLLHSADLHPEAEPAGAAGLTAPVDEQTLKQILHRMQSGVLELVFNTNQAEAAEGFYDTITLISTSDQVPETTAQIRSTCGALPSLLSRTLHRKVELSRCEGGNLQGYPVFIVAYAGDAVATQVVQYMLQLELNLSLVITLTYHRASQLALAEFEAAMHSLHLP